MPSKVQRQRSQLADAHRQIRLLKAEVQRLRVANEALTDSYVLEAIRTGTERLAPSQTTSGDTKSNTDDSEDESQPDPDSPPESERGGKGGVCLTSSSLLNVLNGDAKGRGMQGGNHQPLPSAKKFQAAWNEVAERVGIPTFKLLSPARRIRIRTALTQEPNLLELLPSLLSPLQDWIVDDPGWATVEALLSPGHLGKFLDGGYVKREAPISQFNAELEDKKRQQFRKETKEADHKKASHEEVKEIISKARFMQGG